MCDDVSHRSSFIGGGNGRMLISQPLRRFTLRSALKCWGDGNWARPQLPQQQGMCSVHMQMCSIQYDVGSSPMEKSSTEANPYTLWFAGGLGVRGIDQISSKHTKRFSSIISALNALIKHGAATTGQRSDP